MIEILKKMDQTKSTAQDAINIISSGIADKLQIYVSVTDNELTSIRSHEERISKPSDLKSLNPANGKALQK